MLRNEEKKLKEREAKIEENRQVAESEARERERILKQIKRAEIENREDWNKTRLQHKK